MRYLVMNCIFVILIVGSLGCNKSTDSTKSSLDANLSITESDYTEEIVSLQFIDRHDAEVGPELGILVAAAEASDELDERVLGAFKLPNGSLWTTGSTLLKISQYAVEHDGLLPESGLDLFPNLLNSSGISDFVSLSNTERLTKYYAGINPVSGTWYKSLTSSEWKPGGIYLEPLPAGYQSVTGVEGAPLIADGGYRYTVFGVQPNSVLYTDVVTYVFREHTKIAANQIGINASTIKEEAHELIQQDSDKQ